jgi:hypothetical protein
MKVMDVGPKKWIDGIGNHLAPSALGVGSSLARGRYIVVHKHVYVESFSCLVM